MFTLRPLAIALISTCLVLPVLAAEPSEGMALRAAAANDRVMENVIQWRRDFHEHPELGNHETRTAAIVADELQKMGLDVKTGIAHTGVVAILTGSKPGPMVALRADMDALPVTEQVDLPFASKVTTDYNGQTVGVMHACGHDTHTAMLLGVAKSLAAIRDELPGSVMFIFQPAEEGAPAGEEGGAELMLKEGLFADHKPDAVFGLHVFSNLPSGVIAVRSGPTMAAADEFTVTVHGKQTHGAAPWAGVDPVVTSAQIINALQTIVSRQINITQNPAIVSVGTIHGGVRFNIIPDSVTMSGTIRTFSAEHRSQIHALLKQTVDDVAHANGATADVTLGIGYPVTVNDPDLTARMRPVLEKTIGADHVVTSNLVTGAEDFSYYAEQVPGMFFFLGVTPAGTDPATAPSNHSPLFQVDESALVTGVKALTAVTLARLQE